MSIALHCTWSLVWLSHLENLWEFILYYLRL